MHKSLLAVAAAASLLTTALLPAAAQARSAPESFADLAERLSPSVVNISTTQTVGGSEGGQQLPIPPGSPFEEFFKDFMERNRQGRPRRATSLGSGFIIEKSGLVVTNNHVISEADEISVVMQNGDRYEADVVGRDAKTDLAVLRVKAEGVEFPAVEWGDSRVARVGDWVVAIGNPFGFGGTVTAGIISARKRDINAGPYDDFIQTDASINRGNSGGPLFNLDGEVIGITTAIISPSGGSVGIGFAVPSALARTVIDQLVEFGRPRRGWLGVRIQTVTDEIAEVLGLERPMGALVAGVSDEGPAKSSGIEQGDVILSFDGQEVAEMRALPRIVAETAIGRTVEVEVWRKGERRTVEVKIAELDEEAAQVAAAEAPTAPMDKDIDTLGMKLSAITPELREQFELAEDVSGVVVMEVDAEGSAAEKGIRPGDIVVEVQQEAVASPQQVLDKVEAVRKENKRSVLLLLQRAGEKRFVAVRLDKE